jgi:tyrosine-protein kinase Etk/Wzc
MPAPPLAVLPPPPRDTGVDPSQVWNLLVQRWRTIAAISIAFFVITVALTLNATMEFRSTGRLYLGELENKKPNGGSDQRVDFVEGDQSDLGSEIEIIRSESLLAQAILDSGLNVTVNPPEWKSVRYWRWLLSSRDPSVLDVGLRRLTASGARFDDDSVGARNLQVRFTTASEYELWSGTDKLGTGRNGVEERFGDLTIKLTSQPHVRLEPGEQFEIKVFPLDETLDSTLKKLAVSYPKAVNQSESVRVLFFEFTHRSPHLAAEFLRRVMTGYMAERHGWKVAAASAAESFVTEQLQSLKASLDKAEAELAAYRSNNRVVVLDSEVKAMIEQIGKYEEQRVAARLQLAALSDMKRGLQNPSARIEAAMLGDANDPVLESSAASLSEARQELARVRATFQEDAPEVRTQKALVDSQLDTIRNYVTDRVARAHENLTSFNEIIGQFEERLKTVPGAELGLVQLARESEVYRKMYTYLLERQQQAAISKASTVSRNRILDVPKVPRRETSPSLLVRVPVSLFGVLVGVLFVLMRHVFSTRLKSELDAKLLAAPHQALATLPKLASRRGPRSFGRERDDETRLGEAASYNEALRMLRTNVYKRTGVSSSARVVLFSSPSPGDGKTTTVISLATALAADGKSVLVIDADLRKPSHHALISSSLSPGLSNILSQDCDWKSCVNAVVIGGYEFYSIAAGDPAPAEILSHDSFGQMIASARQRFDFILIDSASLPLVSDTLILAVHADLLLSVLRLQHTSRRVAAEHLNELSQITTAIGIVINGGLPGGSYGTTAHYPVRNKRSDSVRAPRPDR